MPRQSVLENHIDFIRDSREAGKSAPEIAKALEKENVYISHEGIASFCTKLRKRGIDMPVLKKLGRKCSLTVHRDFILNLKKEGYNYTEIANALFRVYKLVITPTAINLFVLQRNPQEQTDGS